MFTKALKIQDTRPLKGFTLIEMLVVISILAILASMLLPSITAALKQARQMSCSNNLKQFGIVLFNYANDNNDWVINNKYTALPHWFIQLQLLKYIDNGDLLRCPEMQSAFSYTYLTKKYSTNYGLNTCVAAGTSSVSPSIRVRKFAEIGKSLKGSPRTVISIDTNDKDYRNHMNTKTGNSPYADDGPACIYAVHSLNANTLFADFHVKAITAPFAPDSTGVNWLNPDTLINAEYIRY